MKYRSKRKYRKRSYKRRGKRMGKKSISRIVKKILAQRSEAISTTLQYKYFFNNNQQNPAIWRPIDPPMAQGLRKYIAQTVTNAWGYSGATTGYTNGETNLPVMFGNKMLKTRCCIKVEVVPLLAYTTTLDGTRWIDENLVNYNTDEANTLLTTYSALGGKIRYVIFKAPRGRSDTDVITYMNSVYVGNAQESVWGSTTNFWNLPLDRTKVTVLKQKDYPYKIGKTFTFKIRPKKALGKYIIPTVGDGAVEANRPYNGKVFILFAMNGNGYMVNSNPVPDRYYVAIPNLSVTIMNTYQDL